MPFYAYICTECEHITKLLRTISERKDQTLCEKCDCLCNLMMSTANFDFRGEGFYETEHGKQQHKRHLKNGK